jgi:hypothetical protein
MLSRQLCSQLSLATPRRPVPLNHLNSACEAGILAIFWRRRQDDGTGAAALLTAEHLEDASQVKECREVGS